jgi:chemotaxis protein CheY-P-specific phosphatase CheC
MELKEKNIANEIVNLGLQKAAESMAFFTKEKVEIKGIDVTQEKIEKIDEVFPCESNELKYVLTTEVKGDLKGVCYLIFSEIEVQKILGVSLPTSILEDPEKLAVMGDAILLEMDNIIVASVITQFSNSFKYKMHGAVPRLSKEDCQGFKTLMKAENAGRKQFVYFKSALHTKELDISPDFLWVLDENFMEGVKAYAANH